MSGVGDDRWRGQNSQNRQSTQRSSGPGSRDRAFGSQGGFRGGHNPNSSNSWSGRREQTPTGLAQERHAPVRGFNASEAKNALKRAPGQPNPIRYKPTASAAPDGGNNRTRAPGATKADAMANGKDFFLELRKQITALGKNGSMPGG